MDLPPAAPSTASMTPAARVVGQMLRACRDCEVTWQGIAADECWCCDGPGTDGPLRLFVKRRNAVPYPSVLVEPLTPADLEELDLPAETDAAYPSTLSHYFRQWLSRGT